MRTSMFATVVLAGGLVGCAGISVTTDFDPDVDLTQYETFAWMEGSGSGSGDIRATGDLVDQRFRRAIESELASRGLQKATSGAPDMFVGYQLALDDKVDYQTMNTYYGSGWGYRGVYRGVGVGTQTYTTEYTMGTLVIDVFDGARHELVWRGAGEGKVSEARNPQERQEKINEAVELILAEFLPGR